MKWAYKRLLPIVLFCVPLFVFSAVGFVTSIQGADNPPKLAPAEIEQINHLAELNSIRQQLAKAQDVIAQQTQELIVLRACWVAKIEPADCAVQPSGELKKPAKTNNPAAKQ